MRTNVEVVLVVHRPGPEFLVALRSPERHGYWNLIAGGVEQGEPPLDAARRELREETGLDVPSDALSPVVLELGYAHPEDGWITVRPFAVQARTGWEPELDDEHVDYRWCAEAEAVELLAYPEPREAVRAVARELEAPR